VGGKARKPCKAIVVSCVPQTLAKDDEEQPRGPVPSLLLCALRSSGSACYWVLCLSRSRFGALTLKPLGKSQSHNKGSQGLTTS
jgi:hypothetical protein